MSFKFEKLEVWQKSLELSMDVDKLTKGFPKEELYILTSQMKRTMDSVVLNIAEGSTGQSNAEFKQFLGYAIRSAIEGIACLYIGRKRELIKEDGFFGLYSRIEVVVCMLQSLRKKLN